MTPNKKRKVSQISQVNQDWLFSSGQICQTFFFNLSEPVSIKDVHGLYQRANKVFKSKFGVDGKIKGQTDEDLFAPEIAKKMSGDDDIVSKGKIVSKIYKKLSLNKEEIYKVTKIPLLNSEGKVYAVGSVFSNITKEEKVKKKLLDEINLDSLTGLYSKKYLIKKLNQLIKTRSDFSLLHIDFNQFKLINDSLGHTVGDKVLRKISQYLNNYFDKTTTIARLGGDEFVILIKRDIPIEDLSKGCQKLINYLSGPFKVASNEIFTSLSIGAVNNKIESKHAKDYLRDAEIALNKAKKQGRGKFKIFDKKMYTSLLEQWNLESELQKAYKNKDFEVFYQPIMSVTDNSVYSFETLIRWNHPRFGYIGPNKFISTAEDIGIINSLDRWVLIEGAKQVAQISREHEREYSISVNLSPMQFSLSSLPGFVKEVIKDSGIKAKQISLEITENALLSDLKSALRIMNQLKEFGVKLTLDDFGTGFASLSYLRKLPIDTLKIDKSFIQGITKNDDDKAVIKMLIELTKELNLKVIAEGVETKRELSILTSMGCNLIQGYYLSRPLRTKKISKFLSTLN